MTTADHATHALSARIRALHGTVPTMGLLDALAAEAENLQRRLELAEARIADLLADDGMAGEAPAQVQAPMREPAPEGNGKVFTHG